MIKSYGGLELDNLSSLEVLEHLNISNFKNSQDLDNGLVQIAFMRSVEHYIKSGCSVESLINDLARGPIFGVEDFGEASQAVAAIISEARTLAELVRVNVITDTSDDNTSYSAMMARANATGNQENGGFVSSSGVKNEPIQEKNTKSIKTLEAEPVESFWKMLERGLKHTLLTGIPLTEDDLKNLNSKSSENTLSQVLRNCKNVTSINPPMETPAAAVVQAKAQTNAPSFGISPYSRR